MTSRRGALVAARNTALALPFIWRSPAWAQPRHTPVQVVLSAGQSLSVGVTHWPDRQVISTQPVAGNRALGVDWGNDTLRGHGFEHRNFTPDRFAGLIPLREYQNETHASGLAAQLLAQYDRLGQGGMHVLHLHSGAGGASILQLLCGAEHLVTSVSHGLDVSRPGGIFVLAETLQNGRPGFGYYLNDNGAPVRLRQLAQGPGLWDALVGQLRLAVRAARAQGFDPGNRLAVVLIHGQSDTNLVHPRYGYQSLVSRYLDQIAQAAGNIYGYPVKLVVMQSQQRGYSPNIPMAQLALIKDRPDTHLGIMEYRFQAAHPARVGQDYTHLSALGYWLMGQSLGAKLGRALSGHPVAPLLMTDITHAQPRTLDIRFGGVQDRLVIDQTPFAQDTGLKAPSHLGFQLVRPDTGRSRADSPPQIQSARLVASDRVQLSFDHPLSGPWRLSYGLHGKKLDSGQYPEAVPQLQRFNAGSLRDSAPIAARLPPYTREGTSQIAKGQGTIWNVAPLHYSDIDL